MPIKVTKTFLVDTNSVDEAYDLTKITNDKVETIGVGQVVPAGPSIGVLGQVVQPGASKQMLPTTPVKMGPGGVPIPTTQKES